MSGFDGSGWGSADAVRSLWRSARFSTAAESTRRWSAGQREDREWAAREDLLFVVLLLSTAV
jgi:hypothetical protein